MLCAVLMVFVLPARGALPPEAALLKVALDSQAGMVERTRAFADLRAVATNDAIPMLAPLLKDPAWAYPARSVVETMPGPAADRALLDALESVDNPALAAGLLNSIGHRRSGNAVPAVAKRVTSSDPFTADAALNALGNIATVAAADALTSFQAPAALRAAWADAAVRVAEALRSTDRPRSLALQQSVIASGLPPQIAAATIGLARNSAQPAPIVAAALKSEALSSRVAALAMIRAGEFGPELVRAVGRILPSLPSDVQVQVLSVLFDRAERDSAPLARTALTATDPATRAAAARLLSVVGDATDAPALVRMMAGPNEPAPSARLALSRLPGDETTTLLLQRFRGAGAERADAVDVLVSRGYRPLVNELLRPEIYSDPTFGRTAANAVLTLGTAADFERVLSFYAALPSDQRGLLETALRRLAAKHSAPDVAVSLVIAGAEKLPLTERSPLLVLLAAIGGERALAALSGMLESPSPETRRAALRALGNWRDGDPAGAVVALARTDPEPSVRSVAIQSATMLYRKSALNAEGAIAPDRVPPAIAGLREIWKLALQPEARNAVIVALRGLKDPQAVASADELEKKPERAK